MDASSPPKILLDLVPSLYSRGQRLVDAGELLTLFTAMVGSAVGLVSMGTNAGNSLRLTAANNTVATTATGTGVGLPKALTGMRVTVLNNGANALLVYPIPPDQLIPLGSATPGAAGSSEATLTTGTYVCTTTGIWQRVS